MTVCAYEECSEENIKSRAYKEVGELMRDTDGCETTLFPIIQEALLQGRLPTAEELKGNGF